MPGPRMVATHGNSRTSAVCIRRCISGQAGGMQGPRPKLARRGGCMRNLRLDKGIAASRGRGFGSCRSLAGRRSRKCGVKVIGRARQFLSCRCDSAAAGEALCRSLQRTSHHLTSHETKAPATGKKGSRRQPIAAENGSNLANLPDRLRLLYQMPIRRSLTLRSCHETSRHARERGNFLCLVGATFFASVGDRGVQPLRRAAAPSNSATANLAAPLRLLAVAGPRCACLSSLRSATGTASA